VTRRGASPQDDRRWVFNRLAADYSRRPGYPRAVVERLLALAGGAGARVADLGAGVGHLALPLARLGARVDAVEPARAMLAELAAAKCRRVVPVHAAAEETGLPSGAFDLVLLADALQWVDPARGGREAARLLAPGGALAVVTPRLADTPFLAALAELIRSANFKARPAPPPLSQLFAEAGLARPADERFHDEASLDGAALDAVLRSLSFVGPALGPVALAKLLADACALADAHGGAVWRREITLAWARRGSPSGSGRAEPPESR
jgi:SAM-dependent methyltransferase